MDPEVLKYFKKIMNSFSVGLLWMLAVSWAGLGFRLAIIDGAIAWYNIVFYALSFFSFALLIWFYYRVWK
jgi:hypothetical protein